MDNTNQKHLIQSQTVWGTALAVAGPVLAIFGVQLGTGLEQDVATAAGAVMTLWGSVWVFIERYKRGDLWTIRKKE